MRFRKKNLPQNALSWPNSSWRCKSKKLFSIHLRERYWAKGSMTAEAATAGSAAAAGATASTSCASILTSRGSFRPNPVGFRRHLCSFVIHAISFQNETTCNPTQWQEKEELNISLNFEIWGRHRSKQYNTSLSWMQWLLPQNNPTSEICILLYSN